MSPVIPTLPVASARRWVWSKAWHGAVVDIDLGLERTEETLGRGNRKSLCKTQEHTPWRGRSRGACSGGLKEDQ